MNAMKEKPGKLHKTCVRALADVKDFPVVGIGARELAETAIEKLRASELKFRTVADFTFDWEYWEGADNQFNYVSPSCERITGYKREEFLSDEFLIKKIVHPGDKKLFDDHWKRKHSRQHRHKIAEFDFKIVKKDGTVGHIAHLSRPIFDEEGNYLGRRISNRDITDRKQYEEQLKLKNEQLNRANADKDKFFSILAHDLRSPFQPLLGLSRMLADDLPTLKQEQIHKMAVTMRNAADKLYKLLENLLEWSRMQRGLIEFNPEMFFILSKISWNLALAKFAITSKEIDIQVDVPETLAVYADSNMIDSVIRNLLSNAIKFTPKNGKINIKASQKDGQAVEVSIQDNGIGMKKEMAKNLFMTDPNSNRNGMEGEPSSGLGLILCRDFIDRNGGKIWIESVEGRGSIIHFTLPGMNNDTLNT